MKSAPPSRVKKSSFWNGACAALLLCVAAIVLPAQTFTTLASFNGPDGSQPAAGLIQGADGNFYGTTNGGTQNALWGTVFKMTPSGTLTTLYDFFSSDSGVGYPLTSLVQAANGNFYGTTTVGVPGTGATFRLTPEGTLTALYNFPGIGSDSESANPSAMIHATDGNFYGTAGNATSEGYGTIFKMTAAGSLTTLSTLNLAYPTIISALIQATDGNFYGTVPFGTIFKVTPAGVLTTLYGFNGSDGGKPYAPLFQAADGNLYGTTGGGTMAVPYGTVFKITLAGELTTLHSFSGNDGSSPYGALVQASDGNFYGTTLEGGANAAGTIFRMTSEGALTTLYSFCSQPNCADGSAPYAGLIQANDGNLYGTTNGGGSNNSGTVFKLTLASSSAAPAVTAAANGASFDQSFAPGMLMSVFGTGLSSGSPQAAATAPLPSTSSSGSSVTINGIPTPLLYISATQINLQIPYEVPAGNANLTVSSGGNSSTVSFVIQAAAPGIFVDSQNGHIVPNESAAAGSTIVLFLTGAGQVTPTEATGNVPATGTTPIPDLPLTLTVGGIAVTPVYVGIPDWSVGVLQVNFTVPETLAAGSQPVVVEIGGVSSKPALLTVTP